MSANSIPYLIAIGAALVVIVSVARRSRRNAQPGSVSSPFISTQRAAAARTGGLLTGRLLPLPGDVGLVAAREIRERVRSRVFRVGTLLVLAAIAAAIVIPTLIGSKHDVQRIGVAGTLSAPLRAAVAADGTATGTSVQLVPEPSGQAATADLRASRIDLAIIDGREVLVDKAITSTATSATADLARAVASTVGTGEALASAGLTTAQAAAIVAARSLPVSSLQPAGPGTSQRDTSFACLFLVFIMLTQYNAWTLTGVLEEKTSRVGRSAAFCRHPREAARR